MSVLNISSSAHCCTGDLPLPEIKPGLQSICARVKTVARRVIAMLGESILCIKEFILSKLPTEKAQFIATLRKLSKESWHVDAKPPLHKQMTRNMNVDKIQSLIEETLLNQLDFRGLKGVFLKNVAFQKCCDTYVIFNARVISKNSKQQVPIEITAQFNFGTKEYILSYKLIK